jgi:small subunit ribosomal protein S4e
MDVISIPVMKKDYRILFDRKGKLTLVPISTAEAEWKLCRIQDKSIISKGKIQLHLHDGNNTIVEKDQYKTGDVLRIAFADKKILDVYPFKKGTVSMITGGGHVGEIANIETIEVVASSKPNIAVMKTDKEFYTIVDYVFPIGVSQPVISLPEVKMA